MVIFNLAIIFISSLSIDSNAMNFIFIYSPTLFDRWFQSSNHGHAQWIWRSTNPMIFSSLIIPSKVITVKQPLLCTNRRVVCKLKCTAWSLSRNRYGIAKIHTDDPSMSSLECEIFVRENRIREFFYDFEFCWLRPILSPLGQLCEGWVSSSQSVVRELLFRSQSGIRLTN